jgi:hypothetical protein
MRFREDGVYVEVGYHHDFVDSSYYAFPITDRVTNELLVLGYVKGKPEWGYTDMRRLQISEYGERVLWATREEVGLDRELTASRWLREHVQ